MQEAITRLLCSRIQQCSAMLFEAHHCLDHVLVELHEARQHHGAIPATQHVPQCWQKLQVRS